MTIDREAMRAAAAELGYWPASTDPEALWIDHHRALGHHPYPAPTSENPERWECKCDPDSAWTAVRRILTPRQIAQKFAHLSKGER
jgi:hypothetical protein